MTKPYNSSGGYWTKSIKGVETGRISSEKLYVERLALKYRAVTDEVDNKLIKSAEITKKSIEDVQKTINDAEIARRLSLYGVKKPRPLKPAASITPNPNTAFKQRKNIDKLIEQYDSGFPNHKSLPAEEVTDGDEIPKAEWDAQHENKPAAKPYNEDDEEDLLWVL